MLVSEISLWGAALIAFLVFIASIALAIFDRQMLRRMLVIFGATVVQMAVVVAVVWLVYQTRSWWAYVIWILLVPFLSICWVLYPLQAMWKKMLRPDCRPAADSSLLRRQCVGWRGGTVDASQGQIVSHGAPT